MRETRLALNLVALGLGALALIGLSACASSSGADSPTAPPAAETRGPSPTDQPISTARATASAEPTPAFGAGPTGPTQVGTVVEVTDGDTIKVDIDGNVYSVRYIGVSSPEIHGSREWLGPEADAANRELVGLQRVLLETDVSETDQYGRLLRHVWVEEGSGWLLVNLELVRLGLAQVTTYPPDVKYIDDLYVPAQEEARRAVLGLWGVPPTPAPTPASTPAPTAAPVAPLPVVPAGSCHASYAGACLTPGIGDYDCAGGSGNGPNYVAGPINVVGYDEFDLDRDGDGIACET